MPNPRALVALAAAGAFLLTPHLIPASATTPTVDTSAIVAPVAVPPAGKAWVVGVITDQAGHPLNGVQVEAWSTGATPVRKASSETYESDRKDGQQGFFNLEVPAGAQYRIVVSPDTDDAFRTARLNGGKPVKATDRKERSLGTSEIARVAPQASVTTAVVKPATVKAGKTATITITVTCKNVAPVLGKVTASVGGKKVSGTLKQSSRGKVTLTLPKLSKPGAYTLEAWYLGDSFVKKSSKRLTVTVRK